MNQAVYNRGIISLWESAFGDSEEFITAFLQEFATVDNSLFQQNEEGEIQAMAFFPQFTIGNDIDGEYLYALAVDKKSRNKGIARSLVSQRIKDSSSMLMITIPSPYVLQEWYNAQFSFSPMNEINIVTPTGFDLGTGEYSENKAMIRILDLERYLTYYAEHNKEVNMILSVNDGLIKTNCGQYQINGGTVTKSAINSFSPTIDVSNVYRYASIKIESLLIK
ncbi:MAG: hypothetical protein PHR45_02690 [Muribaculaceae bacterium]|nr:hypothetical protein [Muribaculaceae bacterium]